MRTRFIAATTGLVTTFTTLFAGTPIASDKKVIEPLEKPITGSLTFGYQGSEHLNTGFVDSLTPLWTPGNSVLFYNSRFSLDDNSQNVTSYGLVYRARVADELIVGANIYYDSLDSAYDHHFDQLGLGVEVLSKWVDFRANYYLPDQKKERISHTVRRENIRDTETSFGGTSVTDTDSRRNFDRFEGSLEGFNTELGFLVPGLDKVAEVRVLGGYYHYLNPFGRDYDGFKGRLEARIRQGLIADVEYWQDQQLTGGHWTGSLRVSLPCNVFNIFAGKNPFEGAEEAFGPPSGDFGDRMSEMVIRSHRVKTSSSGSPEENGGSSSSETKTTGGPVTTKAAPSPTGKPTGKPTGTGTPKSRLLSGAGSPAPFLPPSVGF